MTGKHVYASGRSARCWIRLINDRSLTIQIRDHYLRFIEYCSGWGDYSFNDPNMPDDTPFLTSLAKQGVIFHDFHAGASVCTPSRAALLTGRLGLRTGVTHNFGPPSQFGLPQEELTLGNIMQQGGYTTMTIGKTHNGHTPGYHISYRGYDRNFGIPFSPDMGCVDV